MYLPLSWLKELVDLQGISKEEIEAGLFSCGLEVEEKKPAAPDISGVVVGVITSTAKHENSDHLTVCHLNCGQFGNDIQIVTGASNIKAGDHVPVALHGATVIGKDNEVMTIKNGKLRGVESNGMLCSGEELGITDDWYEGADVYGILILTEDTIPGTDIKTVLELDDEVWDISITANLPHCQSIFGIARELSAIFGRTLNMPAFTFTESDIQNTSIRVSVKDPDLCPRYIAHYVSDVKIEKSPRWMRRRLILCDHKPFNNIVDITNYVLTEMGQPMHAFDLSKLGNSEIVVRRALEKEKITTLDGAEFELSSQNLVICDKSKPVALAGIMGGLDSGIHETTTEILFESAKFMRDNIRHSSRMLGQQSDSSHRFEKGVDEYTTELAMKRALHLVEQLGCGKISKTHCDVCANKDKKNVPIQTTFTKINSVLGIQVPNDTIVSILNAMNYELIVDGDNISATAPEYREDVESFPDLAEDVIKVYGFDKIEPHLLLDASITSGGLNLAQKQELKLKEGLVAQGFYEIVNYSFYSENELNLLAYPTDAPERNFIRIQNPISENYSIMRTTLAPSMVTILSHNMKKGNDGGRFFEFANIFVPYEQPLTTLPKEKSILCFGIFGKEEDFFTAKGAVESIADEFGLTFSYERTTKSFLHPGATAKILLDGEEIGYFGQIAYEVAETAEMTSNAFIGEIDYEKLSNKFTAFIKYNPVSKYPTVKRDLALIADESLTCGEIETVIKQACKNVSSVKLFDIYRSQQIGDNKKSMAFNLTFTSFEKILMPEDVDKFITKILKSLEARLGLSLR